MIRNGFIRDVHGDWYNMEMLESIVVEINVDTYDKTKYWDIEADMKSEHIGTLTIQSGFNSLEEAHRCLDEMMGR